MESMGYPRPDGSAGARDLVAVIPAVQCGNELASGILETPYLSDNLTLVSPPSWLCCRLVCLRGIGSDRASAVPSPTSKALT
jgi:hypothetical protein